MNARPLPLSRRIMLFTLLLTGTAAAGAQTVWRCGPQRNVYQQEPCAGGTAVAADDARDEDQRRSAETLARREAADGERLRREREAREAQAVTMRGQQPAAIRGVPAVQPSAAKTQPGDTGTVPKKKAKKSKGATAPEGMKPSPRKTPSSAGRAKTKKA